MIPVFLLRPPPARVSSLTLTLLEFLSARQSVAPVPVSFLAPLPSRGDRGLQGPGQDEHYNRGFKVCT